MLEGNTSRGKPTTTERFRPLVKFHVTSRNPPAGPPRSCTGDMFRSTTVSYALLPIPRSDSLALGRETVEKATRKSQSVVPSPQMYIYVPLTIQSRLLPFS